MIELLNMDCMTYMAGCEDNAFDLVITSPPYNLGGKANKGLGAKGSKWEGAKLGQGYKTHDDNMSDEDYTVWQKTLLSELWRIIADDGAIFYNHKPKVINGILRTPLHYNPGLDVRQIIIWAREGGFNYSKTYFMPTSEWIVVFAKPGFELKSTGASGIGDVWRMPFARGNDHPAPYPLQLPCNVLEATDGRKVFDPFLGSGTTAIAAHMYGRDFVGTEIDPDYFKAAQERFDNETKQQAMF